MATTAVTDHPDPDAVAAATAAVRMLERLIEHGNWSLVLDLHSTRKNRTGFFALYRGGAHAARTLGPAMHEFADRWCVPPCTCMACALLRDSTDINV